MENEARIPQKGFLANDDDAVAIKLPPHYEVDGWLDASHSPEPLMPVDALRTIINSYRKARLILYETGRLQMSPQQRLTKRRIKLKEDALVLDQTLAVLNRDHLYKGIGPPDRTFSKSDHQVALTAMKDQETKNKIDVFMRVCRGVEKDFRDSILTELRDGMIDTKKAVDHKRLHEQLKTLHNRLRQAHSEADNAINEVTERLRAM
ncbi:hypothetical protein PFICI_00258 [Pestalotiopsis fici W106-1]|uniref:Uncharacterized protein n=1 Tax=Pestalotiopsis fici (strain W106-1 / CGMCC3.15140) TaxID=1229662 RepID=W3XKA4_PESFW|nr:uncharacterized protein PFICI_00258 [Pestalotiopsis fici W106-1]ETS86430.1 hypothetical protein PFICI_00258 [Pestalotiopsis fici W106-1]